MVDAGYTVELDTWDWAAGENFVTRMHDAVDAARRVVALLSPAYFEDGRHTAAGWSSALVKPRVEAAGWCRCRSSRGRCLGCWARCCAPSCSTWVRPRRCDGY